MVPRPFTFCGGKQMKEASRLSCFLWLIVLFSYCAGRAAASEGTSQAERGKEIFEEKCSVCHTIGGGRKVGPDLQGVTQRREREWLVAWISDPGKMIDSGDKIAAELIKGYGGLRMPALGLSLEQISAVLSYLGSKGGLHPGPPEVPLKKEGNHPEVYFLSESYLQTYQDERGKRYTPFYEHVLMELRGADRKLGFYASGWMDYDLGTLRNTNREQDELTYAFLRYTPFADNHLTFNLGRQVIFEGVASEQVDGLSSRWEITDNTGFSLFGGVPVETDFDGRTGDLVYGGRIFQRIARKLEAGISYLRENNDNGRYREEGGIDIWLLPVKKLELQGHSFLNVATGGWMEHSYALRYFLSSQLTATGLFLHSSYDNAFSARTLSAFSPEALGKGEELTKTAGHVEYRWSRDLTAVADIAGYSYKQAGSALYYGTGIVATVHGIVTGLQIHRMQGTPERLRYTEFRVYAKSSIEKVAVTVDTIVLHYDKVIAGLNNVYSINGTVSYPLTRMLTAGLSVDYSRNPDFTGDTMVLFKLAYNIRR
jgi:mono/diheme cytochrome c family protein